MHKLVDFEVILDAKNGDEDSIVEILQHFRKYIDYMCSNILKKARIEQIDELNEDCRQYVFLQLIKAIKKFDPDYHK